MKTASIALITNADIERILALREAKDGLKRRIELIEGSLREAEAALVLALETQPELIYGDYTLSVKVTEKRYPAWKEHFLTHAGKERADRILLETAPRIYKSLIIK